MDGPFGYPITAITPFPDHKLADTSLTFSGKPPSAGISTL
jgi:hypothetical protein